MSNLDHRNKYINSSQLGTLIRKQRVKLKLSQRELSERLNVSQSKLSKIENGILVKDAFFWNELFLVLKIESEDLTSH